MPSDRSTAVDVRERRGAWLRRHKVGSAAVGSLAAVLVAAGAWLFPRAPAAEDPVVPDLVGLPVDQAERELGDLDLLSIRQAGPEQEQEGIVLSHDPAAGATVQRGTRITLLVSAAPTTVAVPDLAGLVESDARQVLTDVGLTLGNVGSEESRDVLPDRVVRQSPEPGAVVALGTRVSVTLSTSPPRAARLEIVDVDLESTGPQTALLTITVRNDGEQVAVITGVEFRITHHERNQLAPSGPLTTSATYDVELPSEPGPTTFTADVSQVVDPVGPSAVDRFELRLSPGGSTVHKHTYTFSIVIKEASGPVAWSTPLTFTALGAVALDAPEPDGPDAPGDLPGQPPTDAPAEADG